MRTPTMSKNCGCGGGQNRSNAWTAVGQTDRETDRRRRETRGESRASAPGPLGGPEGAKAKMQSASEEEKQRWRRRSECFDGEAARLGVSARAGSEESGEFGRNSKRALGRGYFMGYEASTPPCPFRLPPDELAGSVQRVTQFSCQSMLPCDRKFGMRDA